MKRVLIATEKPFASSAVQQITEILTNAGYEVRRLEKYTSKSELLDAVKDIHGLIVRSDIVDRQVIDAAKDLQVVVRAGSGFDNLDLVACTGYRCHEYSRSELQCGGRISHWHDDFHGPW
jgi:D-3-phosphoglycerate dehydrogenase